MTSNDAKIAEEFDIDKILGKKEFKMMLESGGVPTHNEMKHLVNIYYTVQNYRIRMASQVRTSEQTDTHGFLDLFLGKFESMEGELKKGLDVFTDNDPVSWTMKQIKGVGPVIAAGIIGNLDITKANTSGSFLRFCGLDPTADKHVRGEVSKFSSNMKSLCIYKLGESFVKVQNREDAFYGHLFKYWKFQYGLRNERGDYKEESKKILNKINIGKDTPTYKSYAEGKFPKAHIHAMARRKPVAMFLSHLFDIMYMLEYQQTPIVPYVFAHKGHVHVLKNPMIPIYENKFGRLLPEGMSYGIYEGKHPKFNYQLDDPISDITFAMEDLLNQASAYSEMTAYEDDPTAEELRDFTIVD